MCKYICLFSLLFLFCPRLAGLQISTERVGDYTQIVALVPYTSLHPNVKTRICDYQFSIDILDSRKTNRFHKLETIHFQKPDSLESENYPLFFISNLDPGKYGLFIMMFNPELGDRTEQRFEFSVPTAGKKISNLYLTGTKNSAYFMLMEPSMIEPGLDELRIKGLLSIQPDSMKVVLSEGGRESVYPVEPKQAVDIDIKTYIDGFRSPKIKLQVYSGNIKYTKEVRTYNASTGFDARYSLEEQVQQLRLIMNQNELNYIRSVSGDKYRKVIEDFWKMKDPTPDTQRNEYRELFESRILEADHQYSIKNYKPGWKTDRGKIFIKYGQPDEVVADAYPIGKPPYIIWYYYAENKIFEFYDFDGWGNYQLGSVSDE